MNAPFAVLIFSEGFGKIYLHMPVNQPIELEVFVVVTERVDELFCDFEQTHVKEKLEDGIDWNVEVNVHGHSPAPHVLALFDGVALLPSDDGEYEKDISSQGDDLNHGVISIWTHCGFKWIKPAKFKLT